MNYINVVPIIKPGEMYQTVQLFYQYLTNILETSNPEGYQKFVL